MPLEDKENRVVIIDDHDSVRRSLSALLGSAGLQVAAYDSALAFLEQADSDTADCLLVDIRMPEMSGLELQEELTRRGIIVPIVIMSGHADVPIAVSAMRAGAFDFLEKPFDDEVLLDAIQRALVAGKRLPIQESRAAAQKLALLTKRERDVLDRLVLGESNKSVAHHLGLSPRTVEIHRANLLQKMSAGGIADLIRIARAAGLMP